MEGKAFIVDLRAQPKAAGRIQTELGHGIVGFESRREESQEDRWAKTEVCEREPRDGVADINRLI